MGIFSKSRSQLKTLDSYTIDDIKQDLKKHGDDIKGFIYKHLENSASLESDIAKLYQLEEIAISTGNKKAINEIHNQFALRFHIAKMIDEKTITNRSLNDLCLLSDKLKQNNVIQYFNIGDNVEKNFKEIIAKVDKKNPQIAKEIKKFLQETKYAAYYKSEIVKFFSDSPSKNDGFYDIISKITNSKIATQAVEQNVKATKGKKTTSKEEEEKLNAEKAKEMTKLLLRIQETEHDNFDNIILKIAKKDSEKVNTIINLFNQREAALKFENNNNEDFLKKFRNLIGSNPQDLQTKTLTGIINLREDLINKLANGVDAPDLTSFLMSSDQQIIRNFFADCITHENFYENRAKIIPFFMKAADRLIDEENFYAQTDILEYFSNNNSNNNSCDFTYRLLTFEINDQLKDTSNLALQEIGAYSNDVKAKKFKTIKTTIDFIDNSDDRIEKVRNLVNFGVKIDRFYKVISNKHPEIIGSIPKAEDLDINKTKEHLITIANTFKIFGPEIKSQLMKDLFSGLSKIADSKPEYLKSLSKNLNSLEEILANESHTNWSIKYAIDTIQGAISQKKQNDLSQGESLDPIYDELQILRQNHENESVIKIVKSWIREDSNTIDGLSETFANLLKDPSQDKFSEKADFVLTMVKAIIDNKATIDNDNSQIEIDNDDSQIEKDEVFKEFVENSTRKAMENQTSKVSVLSNNIKEIQDDAPPAPIAVASSSNISNDTNDNSELKALLADDNAFGPAQLPQHLDALQYIKKFVGVSNYDADLLFEKYLNSNTSGLFTFVIPEFDKSQKPRKLTYNKQKTDNGYTEVCFKYKPKNTSTINNNDLVEIVVGSKPLLTSLSGPSVRKSGKTFDVSFAYDENIFKTSTATNNAGTRYNNKAFLPVKLNGQDCVVEVTFQIKDGYGSYYYGEKTDVTMRLLQKTNSEGYSEIASAIDNGHKNVKWHITSSFNSNMTQIIKELEGYSFNVVSHQCKIPKDEEKVQLLTENKGQIITPKKFSFGADGIIKEGKIGSSIKEEERGVNYYFKDGILTFGAHYTQKPWNRLHLGYHTSDLFTGLSQEKFDKAIVDLLCGGIDRNLNARQIINIDLSKSPSIYNIKSLPILIKDLKDRGYEINKITLDGCHLWGKQHDQENRIALSQINEILGDRLVIENDIKTNGIKKLIKTEKGTVDLSNKFLNYDEIIEIEKYAVENGKKVKFSNPAPKNMFTIEKFTNDSAIKLFFDLGHAANKKSATSLATRLIKAIKLDTVDLKKLVEDLGKAGNNKTLQQTAISDFRNEVFKKYFVQKGLEFDYSHKETIIHKGNNKILVKNNVNFLTISDSIIDTKFLEQLKLVVLENPHLKAISFDDKCIGKSSDAIHKFFEKISKEFNRNIKITTGNPETTVHHPKASKVVSRVTGVAKQ